MAMTMRDSAPKPPYPVWCQGGLKGRRRENATITQQCTSWRLRSIGISHLSRFHDGTNAFYCIPFATATDVLPMMFRQCDLEIAADRTTSASFVLQDYQTQVHMTVDIGVFPGDRSATKISVVAFATALRPTQQHSWQSHVWKSYCTGACGIARLKHR